MVPRSPDLPPALRPLASGREPRHGLWAVTVVTLVLLGALAAIAFPLRPATPGPTAGADRPSVLPTVPAELGGGVHWSHPVDPGAARVPVGQSPSALSATAATTSPCIPWVNGTVIGEFGVTFSFNTTPANLSGPAPLNLSWNLTVYGGGLPPYHAFVWVYGSTWGNVSYDLVGHITIPTEGLYAVDASVVDSTCSQVGGVSLPGMAWGAIGPHPFSVTASSLTATVPAAIHYAANTSRLPAGWSVLWTTPYLYSNRSWDDHTYYEPGSYNATACFVEPNSNLYACATSPTVVVNGISILQVGSSVSGAPGGPATVSFWGNITNPSILPNGTEMYIYAWNGTVGAWLYSNGTTIALNETVGCGVPWTYFVPLSGNCTWMAVVSLIAPGSATNNGFLTETFIYANVSANVSLATYYPSATFSFGPANGTAPLNLSLNFSMSGGSAPYHYFYNVFGRSSVFANATAYPTIGGSSPGGSTTPTWNGSRVSVVLPLNASGVYWGDVFLVDDANNYLGFDLPLLYVGNVTIYVPAPLHVTGTATVTSAVVGSTIVQYDALVQGGLGPFTVQWAFGDGTYASSTVGATITHSYLQPGRFQPVVTITDASGVSVSQNLPPVTVVKTAVTLPTNAYHAGPSGTAWLFGAGAAAAVALCMALWFAARRGDRREAEALVADLARSCEPERRESGP